MPLVGNYPQSVMAIFGESSCQCNIMFNFTSIDYKTFDVNTEPKRNLPSPHTNYMLIQKPSPSSSSTLYIYSKPAHFVVGTTHLIIDLFTLSSCKRYKVIE